MASATGLCRQPGCGSSLLVAIDAAVTEVPTVRPLSSNPTHQRPFDEARPLDLSSQGDHAVGPHRDAQAAPGSPESHATTSAHLMLPVAALDVAQVHQRHGVSPAVADDAVNSRACLR